jgi:hypothetical protein
MVKQKLDKSSKQTVTIKKEKVTRSKHKGKPRRQGTKAKKSKISGLAILAVINAQLPGVVAKNMGAPGLVYRTGRFASSAEVTDIMPTSKGFLSLGYTYQRDPYEIFEPGNRMGTPDRDPRKVIDKSIREIAQQFALGRFYTRRV